MRTCGGGEEVRKIGGEDEGKRVLEEGRGGGEDEKKRRGLRGGGREEERSRGGEE